MLVEFTVGNFRSIADKVTLSMIAAPIKSGGHAEKLDEENVIFIDDKLSLLKTVALYGANASGKSNILSALVRMGSFMVNSVQDFKGQYYPYEPFLLIEGYQNLPTHFEVVFLMNGLQYRYGFEVSASRVEREWLYYVPKVREALLFERDQDIIKIGGSFKGASILKHLVTPKALFLTVTRDFNVEISKQVFDWMHCFPSMSGISNRETHFSFHCLENENNHIEIVDFIKLLDVGISGIEVSVLPVSEKEEEERKVRPKSYRVQTLHTAYSAEGEQIDDVRLNMHRHESDGTQKLFALAGIVVNVLERGQILAFDEIDAKLHPALTRKIVELFQSKKTNPNNAQLIFATHDTNLLDNRLLRRDQIWFTEKNRKGATDLFSLVELKIRNDDSYEKRYIEGRYGAIPFPGAFEQLFDTREERLAS